MKWKRSICTTAIAIAIALAASANPAAEESAFFVHHVGRIYPSGIAVWGGGRDGQTCRIEHNTVHDTPYTAIACGGDDHRIEHNRIYAAMQALHDGAGIYITFRTPDLGGSEMGPCRHFSGGAERV